MRTAAEELQHFTAFARERLRSGDQAATLDELFDLWRIENPAATDELAIAAALADFEEGNRGAPAGMFSRGVAGVDQPK